MNTTISITKELREKLQEFGKKGETYNDVIERLYKSACERQLHDILMSKEGTVPVRVALEEAKRRWRK